MNNTSFFQRPRNGIEFYPRYPPVMNPYLREEYGDPGRLEIGWNQPAVRRNGWPGHVWRPNSWYKPAEVIPQKEVKFQSEAAEGEEEQPEEEEEEDDEDKPKKPPPPVIKNDFYTEKTLKKFKLFSIILSLMAIASIIIGSLNLVYTQGDLKLGIADTYLGNISTGSIFSDYLNCQTSLFVGQSRNFFRSAGIWAIPVLITGLMVRCAGKPSSTWGKILMIISGLSAFAFSLGMIIMAVVSMLCSLGFLKTFDLFDAVVAALAIAELVIAAMIFAAICGKRRKLKWPKEKPKPKSVHQPEKQQPVSELEPEPYPDQYPEEDLEPEFEEEPKPKPRVRKKGKPARRASIHEEEEEEEPEEELEEEPEAPKRKKKKVPTATLR